MQNNNSRISSFLLITHRIFNNDIVKRGGADYIVDYLMMQGSTCISVEHPLIGGGKSLAKISTKAGSGTAKKIKLFGAGPVRWVQEIVFNVLYTAIFNIKIDYILSVDPLSFFSAYLIRFFTKSPIHFHSVDYSDNRFGAKFLNAIYDFLYKFAVQNADVVTYVSHEMGAKITNFAPHWHKRILFYLPNSPDFNLLEKSPVEKKNPMSLVYTKTNISDSEADLLVSTITQVKNKFPNTELAVIGNFPGAKLEDIKNRNLQNNFKLYGVVPHVKNNDIVSQAYIGLSWYENKISFEKYADSLKIREYAAAGVPIVCNKGMSTYKEVLEFDCGIVVDTAKDLPNAIIKLIENEDLYRKYRENSLEWAKLNDKNKLLSQLFERIYKDICLKK